MWAIRILSGPQAGQIFNLQSGKNGVGRNPGCAVRLASGGISKDHAEITVLPDKIVIVDLKSRNGTFINGVRIQNGILKPGDKVGFYDVIADVIPAMDLRQLRNDPKPRSSAPNRAPRPRRPQQPPATLALQAEMNDPAYVSPEVINSQAKAQANEPRDLKEKVLNYIDTVAMPGIYKLSEVTDFKLVLGGFVVAFIVLVTLISTIPMIRLTSASIETESRRRVLSIARHLASINQQALAQGAESSLTTQSAETEEGVNNAIIVSQTDGSIIAPPAKVGQTPDLPFVHRARRESKEMVEKISSDVLAASVPITFYNPEVGSFGVKAHAIVMYNMGTLAIDDGQTLSLFFQNLILALLAGALWFYFVYKMVSHYFLYLNDKVDLALKDKQDEIQIPFKFDALQKLVTNLNAVLRRAVHGDGSQNAGPTGNRYQEAENVVKLVGFPAMAVSKDGIVIYSNPGFEAITGASLSNIQNQNLSSLPDQALQKNVGDLIDRSQKDLQNIMTNALDFSGDSYVLSCQAMYNPNNEIEYYLVTISPNQGAEGAA